VSVFLGPRSSTSNPDTDWQDGARALREGRPREALARFQAVAAAGRDTATLWIGLAVAHQALGDTASERAALDRALALEPRNVIALTLAGDHHAEAGDVRAASAYYDVVLRLTATPAAARGHEAQVRRAQQMHDHFAGVYQRHLDDALAGRGLDRPQAGRARRAIELLTGRAELYLQQPKGFYFPELPNIQYAPREDFPWMDAVEAATDDIRAEAQRVLSEDAAFQPYVEAEANRPFFDDHGMLGNPSWSAFYLWKGGSPVAANIARCPATAAALEAAPLCRIPGRTPSILFSLLRPGAHIAPHHGFSNTRYICHLPLIVPEGCAMRVGSETRSWVEGRACAFDDTIEHEAWNRHPDRLRVVLIFDVWRPELSELERELVSQTLQAVDAFGA
jgi:aspartate beta-hydroxylase